MDRSLVGGLAAIAGVALAGLVLRRVMRGAVDEEGVITTLPPLAAPDATASHDPGDAAVASDGADASADAAPAEAIEPGIYGTTSDGLPFRWDGNRAWLGRMCTWDRGDLAGARVAETGLAVAPWGVEVLDREGDYDILAFSEREDADRCAGMLHATGVVRPVTLADGRRLDSSDACFERVIDEVRAAEDGVDPRGSTLEAAADGEPEDVELEESTIEAVAIDGAGLVAGEGGVRFLPAMKGDPAFVRGGTIERPLDWREFDRFLRAGEYVGGRVAGRGSEGDPWRVDLLSCDDEYGVLHFPSREDANAALALFLNCEVVRPERDRLGEDVVVPAERFDEARQNAIEAEAELAAATAEPDGDDAGGDAPAR